MFDLLFERIPEMEQSSAFQQWVMSLSVAQQRGVIWGGIFVTGFLLIGLLTRGRRMDEGSRFQVREHERERVGRTQSAVQHARPLLLPGARLDAAPHELLGVTADASSAEIQKAYRSQMLRYHPDRIGQSGGVSPETQQAAARLSQALTQARDVMLAKVEQRKQR